MKFVSLVIETFDLESTAVILSIGMVKSGDPGIFIKFDVDEQIKLKRTVNKSTVDYWVGLGDDVKKKSFFKNDSDVSLRDGLSKVVEYVKDCDLIFINAFGRMCLTSALKKCKMSVNYKKFMDTQTVFTLCDITGGGIKHDPESEAKSNLAALEEVFRAEE